jgi:hypothetical protein
LTAWQLLSHVFFTLDAAHLMAGEACFAAGAIGHLAVDFVTLRDNGATRLWAIDVTPSVTPSLLAFQLFDFLTSGNFNPTSGNYIVSEVSPSGSPAKTRGRSDTGEVWRSMQSVLPCCL